MHEFSKAGAYKHCEAAWHVKHGHPVTNHLQQHVIITQLYD